MKTVMYEIPLHPFSMRFTDSLYEAVVTEAKRRKISPEDLIADILCKALGGRRNQISFDQVMS